MSKQFTKSGQLAKIPQTPKKSENRENNHNLELETINEERIDEKVPMQSLWERI